MYRKETITKAQKFSFHACYLATLIILTGCGGDPQEAAKPLPTINTATERPFPVEGRWYRKNQLVSGEQLYQIHCAECHQPDTSGTKNWRELDAQGRYPPPPLNGTAHTWHHALPVLRRTVKRGGIPLGGWMPGFADKLNEQEIDDIFAWIQSHWSDEIYAIWQERNTAATKSRQPNKMAESQRSTTR
ncbi:MAG: cytochrome c [Candidatus Thiodiazotropha sp. (ex Notomyrtea botanica)]|nr:cytochrome c [Candidatus Thiodiazotropha sp. (ex Notomyrtea botanica)]